MVFFLISMVRRFISSYRLNPIYTFIYKSIHQYSPLAIISVSSMKYRKIGNISTRGKIWYREIRPSLGNIFSREFNTRTKKAENTQCVLCLCVLGKHTKVSDLFGCVKCNFLVCGNCNERTEGCTLFSGFLFGFCIWYSTILEIKKVCKM